jgi:diguanylate cyclase (GGDEF)-like protein/PAS domain S-box-containing protein
MNAAAENALHPWPDLLAGPVIDAAPMGIAICELRGGDCPVVRVNAAFERLTGYSQAELLGTDLRRLQGIDRDQEPRRQLRAALAAGSGVRVVLRNQRKDGTRFWNEISLEPLRDGQGTVTHYAAYYRDAGECGRETQRLLSGLPSWMHEDRLSGLRSRAYFEELLQHDWLLGQRDGRLLTVLMFDIDALGAYNGTFGRASGDACIRRIGGLIAASFRRGSDIVARWEGGTFCALLSHAEATAALHYAESISRRIFEQHIHHPRSSKQKFVSLSGAVASAVPLAHQSPELLMRAAARALGRARQAQSGSIVVAEGEDFGS